MTFRDEPHFMRAMHDSSIGMAIVGADGKWVEVNDALCDFLGYTRDELLKRTFADITSEDDIGKDMNLVRKCIRGEIDTYSIPKKYNRKDGTKAHARLTVSAIRTHDDPPDFLHFISQISDRSAEVALSSLEGNVVQKLVELADNQKFQNKVILAIVVILLLQAGVIDVSDLTRFL